MAKVKASEIIISHPSADFDSFASMVAASKLYPNAVMVLIGGMDIGVREFYALYRDKIPLILLKQIDFDSVERVIVTDTSRPSRLRAINEILKRKDVEVHLYDHHLEEEGELDAHFRHCYKYGSTTTILVVEIARRGIKLTPEEATLLCLGIYEDTGNLTFSSTVPQDLDAVKYLLKSGANLSLVRRYVSHELSAEQKILMQKLTLNTRDVLINGIRIHFSTAKIPGYVDEIAFITNKIQDIENADSIFTLVEIHERVYIIGRSRISSVNIAHILSHFGGGGHPSAGSAMLTGTDHHRALQELVSILREELHPYVIARDIMSSPVHSVSPGITIDNCRHQMIRFGHSGIVVLDDDDRLLGIISRRDVDKAILSGRSHDPVSEHMMGDVITVGEEAGLHHIEKLIVRNNIGRIPVIFGGKVTGIVTRSDIIQALHKIQPVGDEEIEELPLDGGLMQEDVFQGLPRSVLDILILAGRVADRVKLPVYLVGGIVRDILLGRPSMDVDLVVEGNGIVFAEALGYVLELRTDINPRFGTAKIHIRSGGTIDITGTRKERYPEPGALPEVEPGNIENDLKRRDFTINSIAIRINHSAFGEILDPFNGRKDIKDGIIRILHDESFRDDPTRMMRAIRFSTRFGFVIEPHSKELMDAALADGMLDRITRQRIRDELWLILGDQDPHGALKMLDETGILKLIHPHMSLAGALRGATDPVIPVLAEYELWDLPYTIRAHQVYLCILAWNFTQDEADSFAQDFQLSGNDEQTIREIPRFRETVDELSSTDAELKPSEIFRMLHWVEVEALLAYLVNGDNLDVSEIIRSFLKVMKPTKLEITGQDLKNLGFPPSPAFKKAFQAVFDAKLDGEIHARRDEIALAEEVLKRETDEPA